MKCALEPFVTEVEVSKYEGGGGRKRLKTRYNVISMKDTW